MTWWAGARDEPHDGELVDTRPDEDDPDEGRFDVIEDDEDHEPVGDLVVRPRADLVPATAAPVLLLRARQASARAWVRIVDEPAVIRAVAVTRQAPALVLRLALYTPRGAGRFVAMANDWLRDPQSLRMLEHHADLQDAVGYEKSMAAREKKNLPGRRRLAALMAMLALALGLAWWAPSAFAGILSTAVFVGVVVASPHRDIGRDVVVALILTVLSWLAGPWLADRVPEPPTWFWWALLAVMAPALGWLGRDHERPLVELPPRSVPHEVPTLTAPMVIAALCALGNSKMKDPDSIRVLMDPHRAGQGVRLDLELPQGTTARYVVENREKFAGALRMELGTVWPSVGRRHPDHLTVFVSDQVMAEADQEPWPLAEGRRIDIFDWHEAFTDQPGTWIRVCLAFASWVIGAAPRMGKTFLVRQLCLIAGMDPRCKVIALDGKGTGDLAPIALFAHRYVRGARVSNPENIEKVRDILRWLLEELGRRADIIDSLPVEECPESKVTSELVDAHPDLDLGPVFVAVDETQSFFSYGYKSEREHVTIRNELRDGFVELMKLGPALGIWVALSTQLVRESTVPTEAAAVAVNRFALKLEGGHEPNDRILGTGSYTRGIDANMLDFGDKGIGFLKAEGQPSVICRTVRGLDAVESRRIAERIRAMRARARMLTGDAAADDEVEDAELVIDVVEDVEQAMRRRGRDDAQHAEVVDWLREERPQHYAELDVAELSAALRGRQIPIRQVWSSGANRKGVRMSDLRKRARAMDPDSPIGR